LGRGGFLCGWGDSFDARFRSGNAAHAWIFFAGAVPAALARRLGAFLISQTIERLPDIGFKFYDRCFPSQDTMPSGGFGNLIALPLQGRTRLAGNSAFVDEANSPYPDQWVFLASRANADTIATRTLAVQGQGRGRPWRGRCRFISWKPRLLLGAGSIPSQFPHLSPEALSALGIAIFELSEPARSIIHGAFSVTPHRLPSD